ncbi:MAG: Trk system potassium transporter TrkA [Acidobacteriota bacterium]|jgi:trk system potassium uptake protein TrkA|nr:Trk system potassium transporter TrkA [Acidobacteriota bacterium]
MRIVIGGGGEISLQFARELSADYDVVVIEDDPEASRPFEVLDVQITRGKPTHIATLHGLDLSARDKFVACSDSDEQNILACMAAKRLGADGLFTFCFVSKEEYYKSFRRETDDDIFDIDKVIWPQQRLANEIALIAREPEAIDVEHFAGGQIDLMEYRIGEDSSLVGKRVTEISLPKRVLAVVLISDGRITIPRASTLFDPGDKVIFMGEHKPLTKFARSVFQKGKTKVNTVTVIGGGTVGVMVAKQLQHDRGVELKLIEVNEERCDQIAGELDCMVLQGDGSDLSLLREEEIANSDVLVSVTSDDEKNLLGSLLAKQMGIPKIITRVNNPTNIGLFEGVGIDVAINALSTAVDAVQTMLRAPKSSLHATLEQGKAAVIEIEVPEDWPVGKKVKDLEQVPGAIVGAVVRKKRSIVPHGDDLLQPGDHLLVVATKDAKKKVEKYFG